jgi:mono/diheme cytochrome c family protein
MRRWIGLLALVLAADAVAGWLLSAPRTIGPEIAAAVSAPGDAAAGRVVFWAGGCDSCHASPGQPDPLRLGRSAVISSRGRAIARSASRPEIFSAAASPGRRVSPLPASSRGEEQSRDPAPSPANFFCRAFAKLGPPGPSFSKQLLGGF